jgi:hypothetical protein
VCFEAVHHEAPPEIDGAALDDAVLDGAVLDDAALAEAALDDAVFDDASLGAAILDDAGGNPRRTASAGYVAMTTSRVVSRKATNQKPEAMWHHHSYLTPGEPERLNT